MNNTVGLIVTAVLLVPLAGVFAGADAALLSVSRARVDALARAGRPGAKALQKVVADRPRHVNLLLLLRLAAETCGTVLLTVALMRLIQPEWAGALTAWGIMLVVSYVLIGVGPRTLGRQHPYRIGMAIAVPVRALATLLSPLTKLLILIGNAITPGQGFRQGPFSSEVELRELVDMASSSGVVDEGERRMIHSVFEFGDTLVREVLVPRPDVVWTEHDTPVDKVLRLALKSGHSRIPVLGQDIDDIIGVAYLKDLVRAREEAGAAPVARLAEVMRPAVFVPDTKRVDELLKEMKAARNHMAIVVDEYGGTAGVVTIEDLLEEIVGEITDEYDLAEVPDVQVLDDGALRLSARLSADDLVELFPGEEGPDEQLVEVLAEADVDTVRGLLAQQMGKVPLPGAQAEVAGLAMLAEGGNDARGRVRITTVRVQPLDEQARRRAYRGDAEAEPDPDPELPAQPSGQGSDGAQRWEESNARHR